ncbi:MAG: restriction endonuclease subunit S, partial [Treponema sp.]|nr:restriction endonuclease subunit S [Treponema sp.]
LSAELSAELSARRKQYEYYRDELLTRETIVEVKKLGEIGKVCMCKRIMKNQTEPIGDIPFYKIGTFGKQADAFISSNYSELKTYLGCTQKGKLYCLIGVHAVLSCGFHI